MQRNDPLVQAREVDPIKFLSLSLFFLHSTSRFVNIETKKQKNKKKHFGNGTVTRCDSGEPLETQRGELEA